MIELRTAGPEPTVVAMYDGWLVFTRVTLGDPGVTLDDVDEALQMVKTQGYTTQEVKA